VRPILATKASAVTKWLFEIESSASGLKDLKELVLPLGCQSGPWSLKYVSIT